MKINSEVIIISCVFTESRLLRCLFIMNVDEVIIEMFLNSSIENNQKVRLLLYMHESNTLIMKAEEWYPYSNNNATGKRLSFQIIKNSVLGQFSIRSRSTELFFSYKIKTASTKCFKRLKKKLV